MMDGIAALETVGAEVASHIALTDLANDIDLFNGLLDPDLLAGVAGLAPASLAAGANNLAQAALAYAIGPASGGSAALQIIHSAEAIIGRNVDFTG